MILKHQVLGCKPCYHWTDPWPIRTGLVATINSIRLTVISHNVAAEALMWKTARGVKAGSSPLEAALPTRASQRKSVHSCWKVPPGARAWMDTTAKTLAPYHMLHDLRGNTHIHIWVSTSERLSGLLMVIVARIVPASLNLFPSLHLSLP